MKIQDYIIYFSSKDNIALDDAGTRYSIVKKMGEPVAYFDDKSVIFKVQHNDDFHVLKCVETNINVDWNEIIDVAPLPDEANSEQRILIVEQQAGNSYKKTVVVAPWNEAILAELNITRYAKQLHDPKNNSVYRKHRTKVKTAVVVALSVVFMGIAGTKSAYPNQIFVNPIDYRQLILDDSIRTVNIALNKIENASKELVIKKKDIALPTITDLVNDKNGSEKLVLEQKFKKDIAVKKNLEIQKEKERVQKAAEALKAEPKDSASIKKKRERTEEAVRVINEKKTVNFKSTDF
jgi:hypothetical protein